MKYIAMRGTKGNSISSLVVVSICVMWYTSSACPSVGTLVRTIGIQLNIPDGSHGCNSITSQPSRKNLNDNDVLGLIRNKMKERWSRSRSSACYSTLNTCRANFTFLASDVNYSTVPNNTVQQVQFQFEYNFTDFCPLSFIIGYTAWTRTRVYQASGPAEDNCGPARHHTEKVIFGSRMESSYNLMIECVDGVPCLEPEIRLMFLKYKNTMEENHQDLRRCM